MSEASSKERLRKIWDEVVKADIKKLNLVKEMTKICEDP